RTTFTDELPVAEARIELPVTARVAVSALEVKIPTVAADTRAEIAPPLTCVLLTPPLTPNDEAAARVSRLSEELPDANADIPLLSTLAMPPESACRSV